MMHKAWSRIEEVPYCFSRSYVKFQGHTALKIIKFDPNWAFPDCYSSLNSPMAIKCCTKLETAMERCPIVFEGHLSNFKVTRYKTSPILTQIGHFRTVGRSQLSNPSDLPCFSVSNLCFLSGHFAFSSFFLFIHFFLFSLSPRSISRMLGVPSTTVLFSMLCGLLTTNINIWTMIIFLVCWIIFCHDHMIHLELLYDFRL